MRQLAHRLGIEVPASAWPGLVEAAGFASMRAAAQLLTGEELAHYHARAADLAEPDMLRWLHHP